MKYVSLYINFILGEAELHNISMGSTSPDNNIFWTAGLAGHLLFCQISHLHVLPAESRVLYNILSFWQPFLQMLSMDSDGHSRPLVLNSVSLWGLALCGSQATELHDTGIKSCARWGLTSGGFTKHNISVMSHSCLDKLGEFWFPKRRASLRLISCTATPVSADTCTNHAMYFCCSKGLKVTFRQVIRCQCSFKINSL